MNKTTVGEIHADISGFTIIKTDIMCLDIFV